MNRTTTIAVGLVAVLGLTGRSTAAAPNVDIWKAAATGNIEAIKLHFEAGKGMRSAAELDSNINVFNGDTAYTNKDRALLAGVGAAVLNDENVKKMRVE